MVVENRNRRDRCLEAGGGLATHVDEGLVLPIRSHSAQPRCGARAELYSVVVVVLESI